MERKKQQINVGQKGKKFTTDENSTPNKEKQTSVERKRKKFTADENSVPNKEKQTSVEQKRKEPNPGKYSINQKGERKQQIRAELKKKRESLTVEETRQLSAGICNRLIEYPWFQQAEMVYFYYPLGKEVNLLSLAEEALTLGKKIAFPRVSGMDMDFYQVSSLTEFQEGNFHVMEPIGEKLIHRADALVFVPGLGFDSHGNRMGYGKGYYDRYFSRFPACHKVGIAYSLQLVEELASDAYDVPMDVIATENRLIQISQKPFYFK